MKCIRCLLPSGSYSGLGCPFGDGHPSALVRTATSAKSYSTARSSLRRPAAFGAMDLPAVNGSRTLRRNAGGYRYGIQASFRGPMHARSGLPMPRNPGNARAAGNPDGFKPVLSTVSTSAGAPGQGTSTLPAVRRETVSPMIASSGPDRLGSRQPRTSTANQARAWVVSPAGKYSRPTAPS